MGLFYEEKTDPHDIEISPGGDGELAARRRQISNS